MGKLQNIIIEKLHVDEERERVAHRLNAYFHYRFDRDGMEEEKQWDRSHELSSEDFLDDLAEGRSDFADVIVRDGELVEDREFPAIFARWQREKHFLALHEASHACAAVAYGVAFRYVTIIPDETFEGHIRMCSNKDGSDADTINTLAGPAADKKWRPYCSWLQGYARNEISDARRLAQVSQDHFNFLQWLTKNFVDEFAHEIEVVAAALLERETLTSDDVHSVLADMRANPKQRMADRVGSPAKVGNDRARR